MAEENISPEEKLFKIIQDGKNGQNEPAPAPSAKPSGDPPAAPPAKPGPDKEGLKKAFSGVTGFFAGLNKLAPRLTAKLALSARPGKPVFAGVSMNLDDMDLRKINTILFAVLTVSAALGFHVMVNGRPDVADLVKEVAAMPVKKISKAKRIVVKISRITTLILLFIWTVRFSGKI